MSMTEQGKRSAQTFAKLQSYFGFSDARLGELAGYSTSQVEWRRKGKTVLNLNDMERFAGVFQVPLQVLLMDPSDAIRWVLDNEIDPAVERTNYHRRWAAEHAEPGVYQLISVHSRATRRRQRHLVLVDSAPSAA